MERQTSFNPLSPGEIAKATAHEVEAEMYLKDLFDTQYVSNEVRDDNTVLEVLPMVTVVPDAGLFSEDVTAVELRFSRESEEGLTERSSLNHLEVTAVFDDGQKFLMHQLSSSVMSYGRDNQVGLIGPKCAPSYGEESDTGRLFYAEKAEMFLSLAQSAWRELNSPGFSPSGNS